MATTSIWRVKGYLGKVLLYAKNPDKTETPKNIEVPEDADRDSLGDVIAYAGRESATNKRQLIWGINCSPKTAREDMLRVKKKWDKVGSTIAFHGYQSFKKGEVTPELAHKIGIKLAQEVWGEKYQVLVCTHLDKESHIHNHFVVNTISFIDGLRYRRTPEEYRHMRDVSDRLCREYGLSVITHPEGKGKQYSEWEAEQNGKPTYRGRIRQDIDRAISMSLTEEEFFDTLGEMGYELKVKSRSGNYLQRPSLRPENAQRFFRFDRLGDDYNLDEISDRILENIRREEPFPEADQEKVRSYRNEHPPCTHHKGLAALYYHYCYELHILILNPASVSRVSHFMREDLRKMDQLDQQTRFLGENNIETLERLNAYRCEARKQIAELKEGRSDLRNELKRKIRKGDSSGADTVRKQIAEVTKKIKRFQNELVICDNVEKRSAQVQQALNEIKGQTTKKEVGDNELFGRSSGTDRSNESERR